MNNALPREELKLQARPLTIGLSIGARYGSAGGTLGIFVSDNKHRAGFLTSSIAVGGHKARKGIQVYQPSSLDAGTLSASSAIGELEDFSVSLRNIRNQMDAAFVILHESVETRGNVIPRALQIPIIGGKRICPRHLPVHDLKNGLRVGKIGRTSGFTQGIVTACSVNEITVFAHRDELRFFDSIEIESQTEEVPFSSPGDSGALVFTLPDLIPVGLIFAGGAISHDSGHARFVSYATSLGKILSAFQVEVLE